MVIAVLILLLIALSIILFLRHAPFGRPPSAARLQYVKRSPHYRNGKFQNRSFTPQLTEGYSMRKIFFEWFFSRPPQLAPAQPLPSIKTDLLQLDPSTNLLVWFGHSSYFMQLHGTRFLVDPVLSGGASPVRGMIRAFPGSNNYTVDDLPSIDYLLITHDHYDHLDYDTMIQLKKKTGRVICGLGVGAHLEHWGYDPAIILEMDWDETETLAPGIHLHTTTARHFSGRSFSRNNTLWLSYVLETPGHKIFVGGDSGYDHHFKMIGERFGPFDLAIIENGQYNEAWKYIHTTPAEALQAATELKAKRMMPVHSSKFALGKHPWNEPLIKITELNRSFNVQLVTPLIGEAVFLDNETQQFTQWWTGLR